MNKEKWIDEILQSSRAIDDVEPNPFLATRVIAKLDKTRRVIIPLRWVYATAVAMLMIMLVNIFVWRASNSSIDRNPALLQLAQEYGWVSQDLYSNNSN
jgi:hypothetical protein